MMLTWSEHSIRIAGSGEYQIEVENVHKLSYSLFFRDIKQQLYIPGMRQFRDTVNMTRVGYTIEYDIKITGSKMGTVQKDIIRGEVRTKEISTGKQKDKEERC